MGDVLKNNNFRPIDAELCIRYRKQRYLLLFKNGKIEEKIDLCKFWFIIIRGRLHDFNPNLGGLFASLFWHGIFPYCRLKLSKIMLEIQNMVDKYTHICNFRKYTF